MTAPVARPPSSPPAPRRAVLLRAGMEAVVLALVVASPWVFGSVHPLSLLVLSSGVAVLLVLWAGVLVVERGFPAGPCPVAACVAALVALGLWQVAPLPPRVLEWVSPGTTDLRGRLLPASPEELPGAGPVPASQGSISLDPGATRADVVKLLAVLALFAAVRYGVASPGSFRRLAVASVVNGVLLSVVALAQRFSSPADTLYWWFVSQGQVFGPFVNRNHFPFYTNIAFGLGVGLLLSSPTFTRRGRVGGVGNDPTVLWLLATLALVLAATVMSLSRGGVVAAVGASAGVGLYAALASRRAAGLTALAAVAVLGLGLIAWLGADGVGKRLGTLEDGTAVADSRGPLWERVLPLAGVYPLWGTGYGTFEAAELHRRQPGGATGVSFEHAHNEYLNALVEGGSCQLLILLAATGLVFGYGVVAYRRSAGRPAGAVVLGGLLGLGTVAVHSFGEFGLHVPSIVVFTTVVAAQVTAAGSGSGDTRRGGWLVLPVVLTALAVAVVLTVDGWRREKVERFRLAAVRSEHRLPAGERDVVVGYLDAAIAWAPDDARLRHKRADILYDEYLARRAARSRRAELAVIFTPPIPSAWPTLLPLAGTPEAATRDLEEAYHRPALRDYLAARNLNPLYPRPHLRLAGNTDRLRNPDNSAAYLDRACFLDPVDAGNWYLAGLAHLTAGQTDRGWACWRRSLECGPAHLPRIVAEADRRVGVSGFLDRVLPGAPDVLVAAAKLPLFERRPADRTAILARALDAVGDPPAADRLHVRAWLLRELGRSAEAIPVYRAALDRSPERTEWRFELAGALFDSGDAAAAGEEIRRVLRDRPDCPGARDLADAVKLASRVKP